VPFLRVAAFAGDKLPTWVLNPRSVYSDAQYVSASGRARAGSRREEAIAGLVAVFGQSVKGETADFVAIQRAVKNGAVVASDDTSGTRPSALPSTLTRSSAPKSRMYG
jgi:hypothetical protein